MWDILSDLPHGTNKICLDAAVASSEMQDLGCRNVQTWNSMWMFKLGLNNVSPWAETQVAFVAARLIHGLFHEIPHLPHRFAPKAVVPSSKWSEAKGCKRQCLAVHQLGSLKRRAERVSYPGVDRYWNYKVPTRSPSFLNLVKLVIWQPWRNAEARSHVFVQWITSQVCWSRSFHVISRF